jgi:ankyrin repeat protein
MFIEQGVSVESRGRNVYRIAHETPLTLALGEFQHEAVVELLRQGADPNAPNWRREHPLSLLWRPTGLDSVEVARLLVEAGADANHEETVFNAVKASNLKLVRTLLAHGMDAKRRDSEGFNLLHYLSSENVRNGWRNAPEIRRLLIASGADPKKVEPPIAQLNKLRSERRRRELERDKQVSIRIRREDKLIDSLLSKP